MTSIVSEFPCIEATRCLVGETEMGKRLTVKPMSDGSESSQAVTFTQEKSRNEEWYLHIDVAAQSENEEGRRDNNPKRFLQLRHSESNQYLSCDGKGRVTCISDPSDSTWWLMEGVSANTNSLATTTSENEDPRKSAVVSDEPIENQYILISKKYPLRKLSIAKALEGSGEEQMLIASKNPSAEPSVWTLKFTSGELCFIVNPVVHHHMRCNQKGNISLTSHSSGNEIFRFIEVGNGDLYISSWIHYTKFLSSNSDGQIYTTDTESTSPGYAEQWRLVAPSEGNGVYIKNVATRRYLSVGRNRSEHMWTTTKPNAYALWHLDAPHSHTYYLTSLFASAPKLAGGDGSETEAEIVNGSNNAYFKDGTEDVHLSSQKEGPFLSKKKERHDEWKAEVTPEGFFTFLSVSHGKYLGSNSKGDVHTTTSKGAWTMWEKQMSLHGGASFKSKEHHRYLAVTEDCSNGHTLCTTKEEEEMNLRHSWRIDPCIPRVVSGGYLAGAMGLSSSVTVPYAVLGAMEAAEYNGSTQRPLSASKFWVKSDPNSAPSSAFSPFSSVPPPASLEVNGEKESTDTSPDKSLGANSEKESTDTTSKKPQKAKAEAEKKAEATRKSEEQAAKAKAKEAKKKAKAAAAKAKAAVARGKAEAKARKKAAAAVAAKVKAEEEAAAAAKANAEEEAAAVAKAKVEEEAAIAAKAKAEEEAAAVAAKAKAEAEKEIEEETTEEKKEVEETEAKEKAEELCVKENEKGIDTSSGNPQETNDEEQ